MAHLEPPILPLRLYRYRSLSRGPAALAQEIDLIKKNYLYCSTFDRMNDPMEGYFRPSLALKGDAEYKETLQRVVNNKSLIGVACFSETKDDLLMWTHYAGHHSGFCISYSAKKLCDGLGKHVSLVRLGYGDAPPRLSNIDASNAQAAAVKILSQKKRSWSHEREWRVLGNVGVERIDGKQPITDIYFGSRISSESRDYILKSLKDTGITAWQMEVDEYDHDWMKLKVHSTPKQMSNSKKASKAKAKRRKKKKK